MKNLLAALIVALVVLVSPACAGRPIPPPYSGFNVEILISGQPAPQYAAYGVRYIEAIKGGEYSIRLRNPLGVRVAVALSVDGLNTIDARHTDARSARKWVLDPYETVTISGWQMSMNQARRFYFTSEQESYGNMLGKMQDLGIISAVFFRERIPAAVILQDGKKKGQAPQAESQAEKRDRSESAGANAQSAARPAPEEYAATGIGERVDHQVVQVRMDLENAPAATVNIRYEYHAQLVRLGIFPPARPYPDPLARRQQARGFNDGFCPDPR